MHSTWSYSDMSKLSPADIRRGNAGYKATFEDSRTWEILQAHWYSEVLSHADLGKYLNVTRVTLHKWTKAKGWPPCPSPAPGNERQAENMWRTSRQANILAS